MIEEVKPNSNLATKIEKRCTLAIVSHLDAGKTTLTEKMLLYSHAIHLAWRVRARCNQRHVTSDWLA